LLGDKKLSEEDVNMYADNNDDDDNDSTSTFKSSDLDNEVNDEEYSEDEDEDGDEKKFRKKKENKRYYDHPYMINFRLFYKSQYTESKLYETNRVIHFLIWSYDQTFQEILPVENMAQWTYKLFSENVQLIHTYSLDYLKVQKRLAWATIKLFLSTCLNPYFDYFTAIRERCQVDYVINVTEIYKYKQIVKLIRRTCNKNLNRTKHRKRHKGRMIADLEMPNADNPILVLQDLVQTQYSHFVNIRVIDNSTYNKMIHLLSAALYLGPMGRLI
jgi:hypothetical protein